MQPKLLQLVCHILPFFQIFDWTPLEYIAFQNSLLICRLTQGSYLLPAKNRWVWKLCFGILVLHETFLCGWFSRTLAMNQIRGVAGILIPSQHRCSKLCYFCHHLSWNLACICCIQHLIGYFCLVLSLGLRYLQLMKHFLYRFSKTIYDVRLAHYQLLYITIYISECPNAANKSWRLTNI